MSDIQSPPLLGRRPEANTRGLDDLLRDIQQGKIRIPRFQRKFQWEREDIKQLFDSIYRGYPVGSLLFWEKEADEELVQFGPFQTQAPKMSRAWQVVDGQQRLTSLAGVLLYPGEDALGQLQDQYTDRADFALFFDLESGIFTFPVPKKPIPATWLPMRMLGETVNFLEWIQENTKNLSKDHVRLANEVAKTFRDYKFPIYAVDIPDERVLRDIFERLNTSGKHLKAADVFQARESSVDLRALGTNLETLRFGSFDEDFLLQILLALEGQDFTRRFDPSARTSPVLAEVARNLPGVLKRVVGWLQTCLMVPHARILPYRMSLLLLCILASRFPQDIEAGLPELSKWFWDSTLSGELYKGKVTVLRDLGANLFKASSMEAALQLLRQSVALQPVREDWPARFDSGTAPSRRLGCVLAEACPRSLLTHEPIDLSVLFEKHEGQSFPRIISSISAKVLSRWKEAEVSLSMPANRLLHPPIASGSSILACLRNLDPKNEEHRLTLESHLISLEAHAALCSGSPDQDYISFLNLRTQLMQEKSRLFIEAQGLIVTGHTPAEDDLDF